MASLLQADIIIIGHAVIAMHSKPFSQKELCQMKTDETSGSGDENFALFHFELTS